MQISQDLLAVLEQGYSAGGEPELAQQLAKGLRIKGKLNALLKIVRSDLSKIWNNIIFAYDENEYQAFTNEALKSAIHFLLTNQPIILVMSDHLFISINGRRIRGIFTGANEARNRLKNKLNELSVRLQYGGESEYFLISASNTSNI